MVGVSFALVLADDLSKRETKRSFETHPRLRSKRERAADLARPRAP